MIAALLVMAALALGVAACVYAARKEAAMLDESGVCPARRRSAQQQKEDIAYMNYLRAVTRR